MRFLTRFYDILTVNTLKSKDYFEFRREMIVRIFLHIANFILSFFALINFFLYDKIALAIADTAAAIISLYALYLLRKSKKLQTIITISSINIFLFFLVYIALNQNNEFGLIWTIFLPIFIIPLNGHKRGLLISLAFYTIAFVIAYFGIGIWNDNSWTFHSYIRFVLASLVLVYIIYVTELAIYRSNLLLYKKEIKEKEYIQKLRQMADKDTLTQLYNRRRIDEIITKEIAIAKRYNTSLCLAIIDIDFFKNVNGTYGHNIGDITLVTFAKELSRLLRQTDYIARWGGEEFVILFTHTSLNDAAKKCQELRKAIKKTKFQSVPELTCSIGLTDGTNKQNIDEFVEKADDALYKAKEYGRDRVEISY